MIAHMQTRDMKARRNHNMPRRDPARFAPVFVLAPPRSYTSVVTTMIGQHPDLMGLPELKLFAYRTIGDLEASLPQYWLKRGFTHRSPGLVRALAQFEFGGQTLANLARAQDWLKARASWSGTRVLDVLLGRLVPRTAVEKSPENVATAAALRRLASAYPRARYLHLTRHPVSTQVSMASHASRTVPEHPLSGQPMAGIAAWLDVHARITHFAARLAPGRVMRVRAEDVLNDPVPQLRAIAQWLELRADNDAIEAMRHPEASVFACPGPPGSGVVGGHDPGFLHNPVPRKVELCSTLDQPPGWQGEAHLWRRTVGLARRLGYGDDQTQSQRQISRAGGLGWRRENYSASDPTPLRKELLRRRDGDTAARGAYAGEREQALQIMAMDADNTAWLKTTIEAVGWPGHSLVGIEAAHAAWLLAQHADQQPAFQRRCLKLLRKAVADGDAAPADLAHLADRVLLASGKPQLYGSQLIARDGRYVPARLGDPDNVDKRRADMGLDPLADHLSRTFARLGPPRPARVACPNCREEIEAWLPEPGTTTPVSCPACGAPGTLRSVKRNSQASA
jgi:Sulfotransferase family